MKVLLVNPGDTAATAATAVAFYGTTDASRSLMPNLALPTLAAMVPPGVEVATRDEQLGPLDFDEPCDAVCITGYANHRFRMPEVAAEFRRRGRLVVMGGPLVSLDPDWFRPHADVLVVGEAERTWPAFLADLAAGAWRAEYRETGPVDLMASPVPDYGVLRNDAYLVGVVQTSRGCPFQCEFCDVIVYLGRKQRHKTPARVVEELEEVYRHGYRMVFLADDNFTAYRRKAEAIVRAIAAWNATKRDRVSLLTQVSIDVARDPDLLALAADAGLALAFIGIETPNPAALREARKNQNLQRDLVDDVYAFYRAGVAVQAGMIVGFDSDTRDIFRTQYEFLQRAGIATVGLAILNAPEGTPLRARMARAGRLIDPRLVPDFATNLRPVCMSLEELVEGARWLVNKLYAPSAFLARLERMASLLPDRAPRRDAVVDAQAAGRGIAVIEALMRDFAALGAEYRGIVPRAVRLLRTKPVGILPLVLTQYRQVVASGRRRGVLDPALAALDAPDFARARRGVPVRAVASG
ncbi:MAG TPA: radical SAM protein [Candidatus Binatia bacterium]|nr:radical SAM protein [Candidatus Binatia bacterium]